MNLNTVRLILAPVFLCLGTIGNVLSIITVTNKHCKKSSYTVYLAGLAIADILAVYMIILGGPLPESFGRNPIQTSTVFCKLQWYFLGIATTCSIWLTVILALERAFSVYFPFKAKTICKTKNALITTTLLVSFFFGLNSHYLYGMQIQSGSIPDGALLKSTLILNASNNFSQGDNVSLPFLENNDDVTRKQSVFSLKETMADKGVHSQEIACGEGMVGQETMTNERVIGEELTTGQVVMGQELTTREDAISKALATDHAVIDQELMTGEGAIGQELTTGEGVIGQELMTGEGAIGQELTTKEDAISKALTMKQAVIGQGLTTGEGVIGQELTTDEGAIGQELTTSEDVISQALTTEKAVIGQGLMMGEGVIGQELTTGESVMGQELVTSEDVISQALTMEHVVISQELTTVEGVIGQELMAGQAVMGQEHTTGKGVVSQGTTRSESVFGEATNNEDNCTMNSSTDDSSDIHLDKTTLIPHVNDNLISVTTFCGFVDQSYTNFYRDWAMIESILCFWAPVLLIISANTATWIKVYRLSRNSLTSRTAQLIRRTRHVLILTTLISVGFIIFVSPVTILLGIAAIFEDDFQYPWNQEDRSVLQLIFGSLYLCNHCFNFFFLRSQ